MTRLYHGTRRLVDALAQGESGFPAEVRTGLIRQVEARLRENGESFRQEVAVIEAYGYYRICFGITPSLTRASERRVLAGRAKILAADLGGVGFYMFPPALARLSGRIYDVTGGDASPRLN